MFVYLSSTVHCGKGWMATGQSLAPPGAGTLGCWLLLDANRLGGRRNIPLLSGFLHTRRPFAKGPEPRAGAAWPIQFLDSSSVASLQADCQGGFLGCAHW